MKKYNLCNPSEARLFLKELRLLGAEISYIVRNDDSHVTIDEATDEEVLKVAAEIAMYERHTHEAS